MRSTCVYVGVCMALSPIPHVELRLEPDAQSLELLVHCFGALAHFLRDAKPGVHIQFRRRLDSANHVGGGQHRACQVSMQDVGAHLCRAILGGSTHCATLSLNDWNASLRATSSAAQQEASVVV